MSKAKPFTISKHLVMESFRRVKANAGVAGVDEQSLADFEINLKGNLYRLWNRLSSGTYFPPAVKGVAIPKKSGGERLLGIPTVSDRVAQMVVRLTFETCVEPVFLPDSYGYRPNKSALDAVGITRQRCWKSDWVVEFDIKGFFDNLDHELLMRAVRKHTDCKWIILYIERWLKSPMELSDGSLVARTRGVPQGGVISPVLSNLFLHYVFDVWMTKHFPALPWCRYADDGLAHCKTQKQAEFLISCLKKRFKECGLELHPDKTKIVYCKDEKRRGDYPNTEFDFLGYGFRRRRVKKGGTTELFLSFSPAVSKTARKSMRNKIRKQGLGRRTDMSLEDIAEKYNPTLRGWMNYFCRYGQTGMRPVLNGFNRTLQRWVMRTFRSLRGPKRSREFLRGIIARQPTLFAHWKDGYVDGLV